MSLVERNLDELNDKANDAEQQKLTMSKMLSKSFKRSKSKLFDDANSPLIPNTRGSLKQNLFGSAGKPGRQQSLSLGGSMVMQYQDEEAEEDEQSVFTEYMEEYSKKMDKKMFESYEPEGIDQ